MTLSQDTDKRLAELEQLLKDTPEREKRRQYTREYNDLYEQEKAR